MRVTWKAFRGYCTSLLFPAPCCEHHPVAWHMHDERPPPPGSLSRSASGLPQSTGCDRIASMGHRQPGLGHTGLYVTACLVYLLGAIVLWGIEERREEA